MKIAVVGKGLAGLGALFHLKKLNCDLTVFYHEKGASWAASGLMHAFVGDTGEKSYLGDEGFFESLEIFKTLPLNFYEKTSFIRTVLSDEMKKAFEKASRLDLEFLDDANVLIKNGIKVDVPLYLEELEKSFKSQGVRFVQKKITTINEIQGFDLVILACGQGIKDLSSLKMKYLKGQSFIFDDLNKHEKPLIAKGYLVPFKNKVIIGSTYEKKFDSDLPDIYTAFRYLEEPLKKYFKPYDEMTPKGVLSGVRVAHPNYNHPKIIQLDEKVFAITGLGSRGLLYHGLVGKQLAQFLQKKDILSEFFKLL